MVISSGSTVQQMAGHTATHPQDCHSREPWNIIRSGNQQEKQSLDKEFYIWSEVIVTFLLCTLGCFHSGSQRTHEQFAYFQCPWQKLLFRCPQRASRKCMKRLCYSKNNMGSTIRIFLILSIILRIVSIYLSLNLSQITFWRILFSTKLGK